MYRPLLCLFLFVPWVGNAVPLPFPAGARWFAAAPTAGQFARETSSLLAQAGRASSALSQRSVSIQVERSLAFPLTDNVRLETAGVDLAQPWLLFGWHDATYLAAGVGAIVSAAGLAVYGTKFQRKTRNL